jgi:hypothetical protein
VKRLEREHDGRAWQAWQTARLAKFAKKLPRLESLLHQEMNRPGPQSVDAQIAMAKAWHAAVSRGRRKSPPAGAASKRS